MLARLDEALAAVFEATLSIRQRSIFLHFYSFEREGSLAEHEEDRPGYVLKGAVRPAGKGRQRRSRSPRGPRGLSP